MPSKQPSENEALLQSAEQRVKDLKEVTTAYVSSIEKHSSELKVWIEKYGILAESTKNSIDKIDRKFYKRPDFWIYIVQWIIIIILLFMIVYKGGHLEIGSWKIELNSVQSSGELKNH